MFLPARQLRLIRGSSLRSRNLCLLNQSRSFAISASRHDSPPIAQDAPSIANATQKSGQDLGPTLAREDMKSRKLKREPKLRSAKSKGFLDKDQPIRARFAPSPTGDLHLGSLRTALYNKLIADATPGGSFIIRIEDTDQTRLVDKAEKRLLEDLEWAGLTWNEGPDREGPYGPYRQSERLDIYKEHVQTLLDSGHAYRCFCSPEHLRAQSEQAAARGESTDYPQTCRHIAHDKSEERASRGEAHVVRFKSPAQPSQSAFVDSVHGRFSKAVPEEDFIIIKTDGFPTYHFANVVDDHLMKITHVIRGEEWLISTPKHILLYEAFGWTPPVYAHVGLLANPDGTKLSKRHASANLSSYRDKYFPVALLRWLSHLGASFVGTKASPRSLEDISRDLNIKFTKGSIKLPYQILETYQADHAKWLVSKSEAERTEQDRKLITEYIVEPLRRMIYEATHNTAASDSSPIKLDDPEWEALERPLQLTAGLQSTDEASLQRYLHEAIVPERGCYLKPETLVSKHFYLFWRPDVALYKKHMPARPQPFESMLSLIEDKVLKDDQVWASVAGADSADEAGTRLIQVIDAATHPDDKPWTPDHHAALRLLFTGSVNVATLATKRVIGMLGREEIAARVALAREALQEQAATS